MKHITKRPCWPRKLLLTCSLVIVGICSNQLHFPKIWFSHTRKLSSFSLVMECYHEYEAYSFGSRKNFFNSLLIRPNNDLFVQIYHDLFLEEPQNERKTIYHSEDEVRQSANQRQGSCVTKILIGQYHSVPAVNWSPIRFSFRVHNSYVLWTDVHNIPITSPIL